MNSAQVPAAAAVLQDAMRADRDLARVLRAIQAALGKGARMDSARAESVSAVALLLITLCTIYEFKNSWKKS